MLLSFYRKTTAGSCPRGHLAAYPSLLLSQWTLELAIPRRLCDDQRAKCGSPGLLLMPSRAASRSVLALGWASLSRVLLPTPSLPTTVLHGTSEHRPENKWRGCCGNDNSRGRRSTKTAPKKIDRYILFPDRSPSLFAYFVRDVMRSSNYSLRVGGGLSPRARRLNALAPAPLLPKQTASR